MVLVSVLFVEQCTHFLGKIVCVSIRGCREWIRLFIDLCGIVVVETIGIGNSLRKKIREITISQSDCENQMNCLFYLGFSSSSEDTYACGSFPSLTMIS